MAKEKAEKPKNANTTDVYGDITTRMTEQVDRYAGPYDGTLIRFDYTYDDAGQRYDSGKKIKRRYYTYAAIWIEDQDRWYLTGNGNLSREYKNGDLMALLASGRVRRAQVASVLDTFKA